MYWIYHLFGAQNAFIYIILTRVNILPLALQTNNLHFHQDYSMSWLSDAFILFCVSKNYVIPYHPFKNFSPTEPTVGQRKSVKIEPCVGYTWLVWEFIKLATITTWMDLMRRYIHASNYRFMTFICSIVGREILLWRPECVYFDYWNPKWNICSVSLDSQTQEIEKWLSRFDTSYSSATPLFIRISIICYSLTAEVIQFIPYLHLNSMWVISLWSFLVT